MKIFLIITFLFFVGSSFGWVLEVFYRRFVSSKRWINPGFLIGPYLPLYGFGVVILYFLSMIDYSFISNEIAIHIVRIIVMIIAMTLIEYIAGLIFIKGMNIKLWDYSKEKGNIKGIICPLYSLFWGIIATLYFYLLHPLMVNAINWYLFENLAYSFVVGMFYGVMFVDVCYSFNISAKIRKFAKENILIVKYEELKVYVRKFVVEKKEKIYYWKPFKSSLSLKELIEKYKKDKEKKDKSE